jgi:hypothetical protein
LNHRVIQAGTEVVNTIPIGGLHRSRVEPYAQWGKQQCEYAQNKENLSAHIESSIISCALDFYDFWTNLPARANLSLTQKAKKLFWKRKRGLF